MHGLICRAFENFLKERHGMTLWRRVVARAGLSCESFEPLQDYDSSQLESAIRAAVAELGLPRDTLLEDMGTALISRRSGERLRRLLRFGGVGFRDFLYSLEELPARARLALPDLDLPELRLVETMPGQFTLAAEVPFAGAGCVLMGLLRAMADDYGALVLMDIHIRPGGEEEVTIQLLDEAYAEGRRFELAALPG